MSRFYEHIDESIWSDMQDRSAGEKIRKEDDVNLLDYDGLYDYIKSKYSGKLDYIDKDHFGQVGETICVDPIKNVSLYLKRLKDGSLEHVLLSWTIVNIYHPFLLKLEERFFVSSPNAMRRIIKEKDGSCTNKTFVDVIEFFLEHIDNIVVNESIWSDMQDRSAGEKIRKEDEMTQDDLDALDDFIFGFATRVVWDGMRDSLTNFLKYIDDNPEALDCDIKRVKKYVEDNWHKSICDDVEASIEQEEREKEQDMNESLWSDMQDRSTGDIIRKEEDLSLTDKDFLKRHTFRNFAKKIVYYERYKNILSDFEHYTRSNSIFNVVVDGKKPYVDYVKRNWDKGDDIHSFINDTIEQINKQISMMGFKKVPGETIEETLNNWWESLDYDVKDEMMRDTNRELDPDDRYTHPDDMWDDTDIETKMDIYLDKNKVGNLKESIWSDMQDRSAGDTVRKEDEMNDDDFLMLRETAKMFRNVIKRSGYTSWRNTCNDFIKYIEQRKEEHFWNDTPDETYDKVIRFVKNNWGDCTGIQKFMDKYLSNINECDGVPGGLTPADIGGMGPAYFPGPNGEPGSGDLPSPTGIVYKQVAPFDTFIKMRRPKKNKKKKFRKEDEPCVHSPNAKVYDYVDDFRDYVDRTYNNIDKRK